MAVQLAIPIATTVGEFAAPYLIRKAGKLGIKKFIETYGSTAWQSIAGVTGGMIAQLTEPVDLQTEKILGMPVRHITGQGEVYSDIDEDKEKQIPTKVTEGEPTTPTEPEPPEDPDVGADLAAETAIHTTKKLLEDKKTKDITKQTDDLVEGTTKGYKGPITITNRLSMNLIKELTKDFNLGEYGTGLEGFKKEQAGDFPRMPHQYKKYMNYVLEDKLIKKYPNLFKQEAAGDAVFYMFTPIYSDMADKAYGREIKIDPDDPSAKELPGVKRIFALDDEGLPIAAAAYDTWGKDAYTIKEVGSLHRGALDMLLASIKEKAMEENKKYIIAEDLTSKEAYKAFKNRGFKTIPKDLKEEYGGKIVHRPSWRLLKKHEVKSKNLYMPLEHLTEKDLKVQKEMDEIFDEHILNQEYKTSKKFGAEKKRSKGRYFTNVGKK